MVAVKPNKKFLYYEDNGDETCTLTISVPEDEIFATVIIQMSLEDLFSIGAGKLDQEFQQQVADLTIFVPNSPGEA